MESPPLCRGRKINLRENHLLKSPLFFFLMLTLCILIYSRGDRLLAWPRLRVPAPPTPTLWLGRLVWGTAVRFVEGKGWGSPFSSYFSMIALKSSGRVIKRLCWVNKSIFPAVGEASPALAVLRGLCTAVFVGCRCSRTYLQRGGPLAREGCVSSSLWLKRGLCLVLQLVSNWIQEWFCFLNKLISVHSFRCINSGRLLAHSIL